MFSGRPQVLLMLKRLINYIGGHAGVPRSTMEAVAADIRGRFPCQDKEPPRDY
jgi:hypothetical protein